MDRRIFLKSTGLALVAGGFLPNVFVRMARAGTPENRRVLVVVFQRGRGRRLERRRSVRRKGVLRRAAFDRRSASRLGRRRGARPRRLLRSASFARADPAALHRTAPPHSCTRPAAPTRRGPTSTPRTSWSRAPGDQVDGGRVPLPRPRRGERKIVLSAARGGAHSRAAPDPDGSRRRGRRWATSPSSASERELPAAGVRLLRVHVRRSRRGNARAERRRSRSKRCEFSSRRILRSAGRERCGLPEEPVRKLPQADRAAHQVGRRARDRLHGRRRLGHARGRGRRERPARQPPARLRPDDRRVREGPRLANGGRDARHGLGVRKNGPRKRQPRHRPRPRERDAGRGRRREGRKGLRPVAGADATSSTKTAIWR